MMEENTQRLYPVIGKREKLYKAMSEPFFNRRTEMDWTINDVLEQLKTWQIQATFDDIDDIETLKNPVKGEVVLGLGYVYEMSVSQINRIKFILRMR